MISTPPGCPPAPGRARRPHRLAALAAAATVSAAALGVTPTPVAADPAPRPAEDGSLIREWNATAMDVLTPSGRPLLTQLFVVAAMHVAMYDAVMAIEDHAAPFATHIRAPSGASVEAAAATAAHRVLVGFLPASASVFDGALADSLAGVPDGPAEAQGILVGQAAGWGTLALRLHDGSQTGPLPPMLPPGPGVWAPTPPNTTGLHPWLATAQPFAMRSPDQFRPSPPPALDSARYQRALDEIRRLGGTTSTQRSAEQTTIARFWSDQPLVQNQRTIRVHAEKLNWGLAPTARLFAAVLTSEADAMVACWDAKFHYQLWRPWQSVPTVEPGWTPLLTTPNHPEYPSAHGCLTGALAHSLARIMRTRRIGVEITAANLGTTRHYATRDDLLNEVAMARIWGGLHYRFSVEAGLRLADQVVDHNLDRNFLRTR
jgi:hypothetical protein